MCLCIHRPLLNSCPLQALSFIIEHALFPANEARWPCIAAQFHGSAQEGLPRPWQWHASSSHATAAPARDAGHGARAAARARPPEGDSDDGAAEGDAETQPTGFAAAGEWQRLQGHGKMIQGYAEMLQGYGMHQVIGHDASRSSWWWDAWRS